MYVVQLSAEKAPHFDAEEALEALDNLLGVLRMGGRILGREFPMVDYVDHLMSYVMVPEENSLADMALGPEANRWIGMMHRDGLRGPTITVLGHDPASTEPCSCDSPTQYVLYTTGVTLESPLRCGDCFLPVPLYRIPPTYDHDYYNVITWQSEYQSCDQLWLNSGPLERDAYEQLSSVDSDLSREGIRVARSIETLSGKPTYYHLLLGEDDNEPVPAVGRDRCPSCQLPWRLEWPWHDRFHYKCTNCHLLGS